MLQLYGGLDSEGLGCPVVSIKIIQRFKLFHLGQNVNSRKVWISKGGSVGGGRWQRDARCARMEEKTPGDKSKVAFRRSRRGITCLFLTACHWLRGGALSDEGVGAADLSYVHAVIDRQTLRNSDRNTVAGDAPPCKNVNSALSDRRRRLRRRSNTRSSHAGRRTTLYGNFISKLMANRKAESIRACLHFSSYMPAAWCRHEHVATLTVLFPLVRGSAGRLLSFPQREVKGISIFEKKKEKEKIKLNPWIV